MQYLLSEEEYAKLSSNSNNERLVNENKTLREFNSKKKKQITDLQEQLKNAYMDVYNTRTRLEAELKKKDAVISDLKKKLEEASSIHGFIVRL